jgi:SAM-dependent methyltransferase
MSELRAEEPDYGNWIPMRLIYISGGLVVLFLALSFVFPLSLVGLALFILVFGYYAYARFEFSARRGNLQIRIQQLVLDRLDWEGQGKAIDIGCGNGPLTIKLAKKFPEAQVTGIDYWGKRWEYSKSACEKNAEVEGVSNRVSFQKASASALPFEDGYFDAAVSNLVFHEVSDTKDKREVIKEALRVVKKGGKFAFQDLFLRKRIYGEVGELLNEVRSWGVEYVEFVDTSQSDLIPILLRPKFMSGAIALAIGLLYGRK